jgi:hypothetical protein
MTRPRRRQGTPAGSRSSIPGNWLRISRHGGEDEPGASQGRLSRVVAAAARRADAHGDEAAERCHEIKSGVGGAKPATVQDADKAPIVDQHVAGDEVAV